jgi:hypothetical protein
MTRKILLFLSLKNLSTRLSRMAGICYGCIVSVVNSGF